MGRPLVDAQFQSSSFYKWSKGDQGHTTYRLVGMTFESGLRYQHCSSAPATLLLKCIPPSIWRPILAVIEITTLGKSPNLSQPQISSFANGDHYSYVKAGWELVQGNTSRNSWHRRGLQATGGEGRSFNMTVLLCHKAINTLAYSPPVALL